MTISSISGTGKYAAPGMDGKFYSSSRPNADGELSTGSLRYRPAFWRYGRKANTLYHPVKSLKAALNVNRLYQQQRGETCYWRLWAQVLGFETMQRK